MNVLSLFSGIDGLGLGLERAGMTVVGQVEINPFCREILARHWPEVPRHDDVRTVADWWTAQPRPRVDVVAGGFPCQPFSFAGRRRGTADERWGWPWMLDVIRLVQPRYVLVENVADLLRFRDAFGWILSDLAELGFDAEWSVLSACSVGAPHTRERLFLVAYPEGGGFEQRGRFARETDSDQERHLHHWSVEPQPPGVADGVSDRLHRIHALGNAVVVPVAERIGRMITAAEHPAQIGEVA